jgi:undecaprenyl-diphosphatase
MFDDAGDVERVLTSEHPALPRRSAEGLRSPGWLGRWPLIGLLLVVFGLTVFGVFAINVQTNGPLVQADPATADQLHRQAIASPAWLRTLMVGGYYFGQHVIVAIGAGLVLYFMYRRFWRELAMVVIAWAGEGSLWLTLAPYFDRPRPVFDQPVLHQMTAPGFPSGHSISAVMCYGLLAYLIVPRVRSGWGKAVVVVLAVLMIAYIAFSRVFIGDHYVTDVLAGLALGVAWSGLVYTGVELAARHRRRVEP